MRKDVEIKREVRWLSEERRWEARVTIRLATDKKGNLGKIFRNKNKELAGERLTYTWGGYKFDGIYGWREKEIYEVFDSFDEAKKYTERKRDEVIEQLNDIMRENVAMMLRELESDEVFRFDEKEFRLVRE